MWSSLHRPPLVSIPGWIIAKCKGAKLVYDVRDIWPDVALEMGSFVEGSIYCKVFRAITRFMYKHSDWVTTVSPGKVEKIKSHVISVGGKRWPGSCRQGEAGRQWL